MRHKIQTTFGLQPLPSLQNSRIRYLKYQMTTTYPVFSAFFQTNDANAFKCDTLIGRAVIITAWMCDSYGIFTACKRSCGKVIFSLVSVILSTGDGVVMPGSSSIPGRGYAWSQVPSWGWVCLVPGPSKGVGMPCPRSLKGVVGISVRYPRKVHPQC